MSPRSRAGVGVALALALGCRAGEGAEHHHDDVHGHDDDHDGEHEHDGARSLAAAWVPVERPHDASLLELPARTVAAHDSRARLDAPLRATVVGVFVEAGTRVEAGTAIVELHMPDALEAAATIAGSQSQIAAHRDRREQLEQLQAQGMVGAAEVFSVDSRLGELTTRRRSARATLRSAGIDGAARRELLARGTVVLSTPVAGVLAELDATPGEVVDPGETLAQVFGRGPLRIEVAHSGELPSGLGLDFLGPDGERIPLRGEPIATAREPGLGRTLAWYEPLEPREGFDGVRGRVVVRAEANDLLEVPRRSLRLSEGRAWVARRPASGGTPEPVAVEVLRSVGSSALVRSSELALGDRVSADVTTVLQLGRDADELGGGHHH